METQIIQKKSTVLNFKKDIEDHDKYPSFNMGIMEVV